MHAGDFEGAERIYRLQLDKAPRYDGVPMTFVTPRLARVYLELERPADAIAVLQTTGKNVISEVYQPLLCIAYCRLNDLPNARRALTGSLYISKNLGRDEHLNVPRPTTLAEYEATAWAAVGIDEYSGARHAESHVGFSRAAKLWPDQAVIAMYYALSCTAVDKIEDEKEWIEKAQRLGKGDMPGRLQDEVESARNRFVYKEHRQRKG